MKSVGYQLSLQSLRNKLRMIASEKKILGGSKEDIILKTKQKLSAKVSAVSVIG